MSVVSAPAEPLSTAGTLSSATIETDTSEAERFVSVSTHPLFDDKDCPVSRIP